ncbi:MAG: 1-acyl-sn-glycerol-3-phosphate acyltransferase [bacterium]
MSKTPVEKRGGVNHGVCSSTAADERPRVSNRLLSFIRVLGFALVTVITGLAISLSRRLGMWGGNRLTVAAGCAKWNHYWGWWCMKVFGDRVVVRGTPPPPGTLIVPNHTGYADIMAVSSVMPCLFVAKSEAADWPVLGLFIRLAAHVIVTRENPRSLFQAINDVEQHLKAGITVCVFLEGTSSGGASVLPFRPSMVEAALRAGAQLTPAAILWDAPLPAVVDEDIAYWKDHRFPVHFWKFLGLRGVTATIEFGQKIPTAGLSRKTAAGHAQAAVEAMLRGENTDKHRQAQTSTDETDNMLPCV